MFAHPKRGISFRAEPLHIFAPVAHLQNPPRQPSLEILCSLRLIVILAEECVVATIVALNGRRMRAARAHGPQPTPETPGSKCGSDPKRSPRARQFLRRRRSLFERARAPSTATPRLPQMCAFPCASARCTLNDRNVRPQRAHRNQFFFTHGRWKFAQVAVFLQQIAAERGIGGHERYAQRRRVQVPAPA